MKEMTKAEKDAYKARVKEYVSAGVDKELAKTLAKVEVDYGMIKPVVNSYK